MCGSNVFRAVKPSRQDTRAFSAPFRVLSAGRHWDACCREVLGFTRSRGGDSYIGKNGVERFLGFKIGVWGLGSIDHAELIRLSFHFVVPEVVLVASPPHAQTVRDSKRGSPPEGREARVQD